MVEWRRPWIGVQSASSATSFRHSQRFLQRHPCYFGDMRITTAPFVHEEFPSSEMPCVSQSILTSDGSVPALVCPYTDAVLRIMMR